MPCPDYDRLAAFAEKRITGEDEARLARHLEDCAACRSRLEELTGLEKTAPRSDGGAVRSAARPLERGDCLGRYLVIDRLGEGSMGAVYCAFDPELDRRVALKVVRERQDEHDDSADSLLLREAKAIARLTHPNVVSVFDVGAHERGVFVAMELASGGTLRDWLRKKPRSWREVVAAFVEAGKGLAAAHAAGLVHRDFKPENVLVGDDGRILVTDFGLARWSESAGCEGSARGDAASPEPGALLGGTPAYMAPEQLTKHTSDARSDQFSFCVALWEALSGERPFKVKVTPLGPSVKSWSLPEAPMRGVPSWLVRVLARGLSEDPERRWPSMQELLAALRRHESAARRRWGLGLGALLATGAVVAAVAGGDRSALCSGAEEAASAFWTTRRGERIAQAFAATHRPGAQPAAAQVLRELATYAKGWSAAYREACEATRVRGEQSEAMLDKRMVCLARRRDEARALVELFEQADGALVDRAVRAAQSLSPLADCSDLARLASRTADPPDRERAAGIQARLDRAKAAFGTGRFVPGQELVARAAEEATDFGWGPLLAEALVLRGQFEMELGQFPAARRSLLDALRAATVAGDDASLARAAYALTLLLGEKLEQTDEALDWAVLADASIERLGGDETLQARLDYTLGAIALRRERAEEALAHFERARENQARLASESLVLSDALWGVGTALQWLGKDEQALGSLNQAVAMRARLLGEGHELVARARNSVANSLVTLGRLEEAESTYLACLESFTTYFGPEDYRIGVTLRNLAAVYSQLGRSQKALETARRALAIEEKALGESHPKLARLCDDLGGYLVDVGRPDESLPFFERAGALREGLPKDDPARARHLIGIGRAHLAAGRVSAATGTLERAVAGLPTGKGIFYDESGAAARFTLAKALWEGQAERARSLALAKEARAQLAAHGEYFKRPLAEIDGWLAQRAR